MSTPDPNSNPPQPQGAPPAPPAYGTPPPAYSAAPAYPPAGGYPQGGPAGYPAPPKTNTLAIVSLISGIVGLVIVPFIGSIVAVITGHMSLSQLKRSGEAGRGMALAGTIIGWVGLALAIIGLILFIAFWSWFIANADQFSTIG